MSYITAKLRERLRRTQDEAAFLSSRLDRERRAMVHRVTMAHDFARMPAPSPEDAPLVDRTSELLLTQPGEKLCHYVGLDYRQGDDVARAVTALLEACVGRRQIPLRVTYQEAVERGGVFTLHSFKVRP